MGHVAKDNKTGEEVHNDEKEFFLNFNASSYLKAYIQLSETHYKQSAALDSWYSNLFFPMVTVLTFGIELHIKGLLQNRENRVSDVLNLNTHSMSNLFQSLEKLTKKKIFDEWFVFYKLRGGEIKSGTDKYRYFNQVLNDFHDIYESIRYVHEDFNEKSKSFEVLLLLFEPLLFSISSNVSEYTNFINRVVKFDEEIQKKNMINSIRFELIKMYKKANNEEWSDVKEKIETTIYSLKSNNKSLSELFNFYYELSKEND